MNAKFLEKQLSSKSIYKGKFFEVVKDDVTLSTGQDAFREVVKHPGGVVVVALKDAETILMVKQYRYPIDEVSLELPAGKLEIGENPDLAIQRELEEETGYVARNWESLGYIYPSPGFCDEKLYLYLASELTFKKQNPDDGEIIEYFEYKLSDVLKMINSGEIVDSKTICALARFYLKENCGAD